ncbi:MAG TPA: iron ABC transporter permease [Terracidiphilus sp.]|nr:iron ABC transporter permease [Terracidiphilus sp.]
MARQIAETPSAVLAPAESAARARRDGLRLVALSVLLIAVSAFAVSVGAISLPFGQMLQSLIGHNSLPADERTILLSIRLPRVLAAAMTGSALSVSGLLFQGLFRNPLADPYVIGSSGGAVLGASIGVFLLPSISVAGFGATALFAFGGATCAILLVYSLASVQGRTPVVALLLSGFAVSTMLSYSSYFLEVLDHDFGTGMRVLTSWLHGTISQPTWPQLTIVALMLLIGLAGSAPLARDLNTLALGEEYATHLGLHVQKTRIEVILIGSVLTAAAVALGGLISFVGLMVPHTMRILLGPDHVRLLPFTALAGAIFLLIADTVARTIIAPAELPVGVLTAVLGGPFFLYLLRKVKDEVFQ